MKKYIVIATPPNKGLYADLAPRAQQCSGATVYYDDYQLAKQQSDACNSDHNGWKYSAMDEDSK